MISPQKLRRRQVLKERLVEYISSHPGCAAEGIVADLGGLTGMRGYHLTTGKVGNFIKFNMKDVVYARHEKGKNAYYPLAEAHLRGHNLEDKLED